MSFMAYMYDKDGVLAQKTKICEVSDRLYMPSLLPPLPEDSPIVMEEPFRIFELTERDFLRLTYRELS